MFINENSSEKSEKEGVQALVPDLEEMKNLTPLDLSGSVRRTLEKQKIAKVPENKSTKVDGADLDLKEVMESFILHCFSGNNYEKEGPKALVPDLQEIKNLTPLDSSENNYEKEGAQKLAKVFENKSTKVDGADVTKHTGKEQQAVS